MEKPSKRPRLVRASGTPKEGSALRIERIDLLNRLNHIHFQNGTILLVLEHARRGYQLSLKATPQPASSERIDCRWAEQSPLPANLGDYRLKQVQLADGPQLIAFVPERPSLSDLSASFLLPEAADEIGVRQLQRHRSAGVSVQLCQHGTVFSGELVDFNATSLRVEIAPPADSTHWLDPEATVHLLITSERSALFAGECRVLRQPALGDDGYCVLQPANSRLRRFPPRQFRSTRQQLCPAPDIIFRHPLSERVCHLPVVDLSGSGFAVEEEEDRAVLVPGLVLPELEISLANSCRLTCSAQVVYRQSKEPVGETGRVKCGLAILDMSLHDQGRLLGLLQQAQDSRATLGARIDLEELWKFFFDSGFLYPEKYLALLANKEKFKETYRKFYSQDLGIARHFIYQEGGRILGHIAMLRFYDRSWLIHHHAASRQSGKKAGLKVLGQISRYVNELHHLPAAHLNYVFCYFRPENRFPNRLFGGAARHIDDPDGCVLYPFAYLSPRKTAQDTWELPAAWQLTKAGDDDLRELRLFLAGADGAMLIDAFDLKPGPSASAGICQEYEKVGCRRDKQLFALKHNGTLQAVVLVDTADLGLNLSELTNAIKVLVLDPEGLPRDILQAAIAQLGILFDESEPAVLIYPQSYADSLGIDHDKTYNLWILNLRYLDRYFQYCQRFLRDTDFGAGMTADRGPHDH